MKEEMVDTNLVKGEVTNKATPYLSLCLEDFNLFNVELSNLLSQLSEGIERLHPLINITASCDDAVLGKSDTSYLGILNHCLEDYRGNINFLTILLGHLKTVL